MSEKDVKGARGPIRVSTLTGTLVIVVVIVLLVVLRMNLSPDVHPLARRVTCASNMKILFVSLALYAEAHGGAYPAGERWCDLLVEWTGEDLDDPNGVEALRKAFRCPAGPEGGCHYALNPDCEPNSPGDMVLLFETKAGWNQNGGPKLFTFDNHDPKGGRVLLNDGTGKCIPTEEELHALRWK